MQDMMTQDLRKQSLEQFLKKESLNRDWKNWVRINIKAGCDKNSMFKIMADEGFSHDMIKDALNFEPAIPLDQIINPLKESATAQRGVAPFIPNAGRLPVDGLELYILEDFLNEAECEYLVAKTMAGLRPSTITSSEEPDKYFRSSSTCELGILTDDFIKDIDRRICAVVGLDPAYSEVMQGQHYEVGQEFKAHTDVFEQEELAQQAGTQGQRSYTFMIYLNDVAEGGETSFPNIDKIFVPKRGMAVIWNSLHPDGTVNQNSLHHAHPVKKGSKTVITKWFRTRAGLPVFSREENENIANFTRIGFQKDTLPKPLFEKLIKFYHDNRAQQVEETGAKGFIENTGASPKSSSLVELTPALQKDIHSCLRPVLELWSGIRLDPTYVYGIRIYHNGTVLKAHRDRIDTHIISAIINIDQEVNKDWPLYIEDNYYRQHRVMMKPGEIVYYEGGRLSHGRPEPLDGHHFANIFCHFRPLEE